MNSIAIIPARGSSKGVPRKNIKLLNGKPLIYYTIEAARELFADENILISTDSQDIKDVVEKIGLKVHFLRPDDLATDTASSRDVLLHAIEFYESKHEKQLDVIVLLQPTSPFRNGNHLREALKLWEENLDMVVSVKETASNPYYILFEESPDKFLEKSKKGAFTRRQDCPQVWEYNGAIYIISVSRIKKMLLSDFKKVKKYVMSELDSIDIDTPLDWLIAEQQLKIRS